ncbi:MAG TPA: IPT/TIG domain-containing protein [Blastocatellia bacterium]|nr:IPT/TIG domain-containing protein [Blastocatellia bacterium]
MSSESLVRRLAAKSAFIAIIICWLWSPGAYAQVPPAPALTSLSPSAATAGGSGFTLTVNGSEFLVNSVVRWNGSDRPTAFVSRNQLTAMISSLDIATAGSASVTVFNPPSGRGGGGLSNAATFTITPQAPQTPTIITINPNSTTAGGPGFTLTVTGTNFVDSSVVRWNGADRTTAFVSPRQLTALITPSDIAVAGTANVMVFTQPVGAAGGGASNAVPFTISQQTNPAPILNSLNPNPVTAGGPGFMLTVAGSNFVANSTLRINGATRPTTFVSATQLTAMIPASDIASAGTASVTVDNPAPGGGTSNAAQLNIVSFTITPRPLPAPTLTSVAASAVTQGARQMRLTLVGANFRPGARVIIGQSESNAALAPAADIIVENVNRISDTAMQVVITASPQALIGARSVDVINADNSNTGAQGSNTTKPLRVAPGSSLGAPLQIVSLVVTHPRTGTAVAQGDETFAEAILSGAGTGAIIGQWLWDGNVFEQFTINITGGERRPLKTSNSLPTFFIGPHTLELKILSPNVIQSPQITVLVNPGTWKITRLLAPNSGRGYTPQQPPLLRWTIAPGAAKYQVGFSTQPFLRTVTQWREVADTHWQVPATIWGEAPEGELFWTVRVVETSGETRKPAPMRRIYRVAGDALTPGAATGVAATGADATGVIVTGVIASGVIASGADAQSSVATLSWQGLRTIRPAGQPVTQMAGQTTPGTMQVIYRATITRDAEGRLILRRFLTDKPQLDLRSIQSMFSDGENYYWRVEAFSNSGRLILSGARNVFTPKLVRDAQRTHSKLTPSLSAGEQKISRRAGRRYPDIASLTLPPLGDDEADPDRTSEQNLADQIVNRLPAPNQTVIDLYPMISVEFKNAIDSSRLTLVIDDTDVTAVSRIAGNILTFKSSLGLTVGRHQIALTYGNETINWYFNVGATPAAGDLPADSAAATPGTDAEAEPPGTPVDAGAAADEQNAGAATENQFTYEATSNSQAVSGSEAETNNLSLSAQGVYANGPWRAEMNGSGVINSIFGPRPRHLLGQFNDYVFRLTRQASESRWGADASFGMIAPQTLLGAEFINTGFPRESVEASFKTPGGKFSIYRNTNDKGQGEGVGFGFHQQVNAAGYETPPFAGWKDPERVKFRTMWLSARDVGGTPLRTGYGDQNHPQAVADPLTAPRAGESVGGTLSVKLNRQWAWNSEYAIASNSVNRLLDSSRRAFGRAWRTGFAGIWNKADISVAFRDVSPNYAIPATASLTQLGMSDRRGLDASVSRDTIYGKFFGSYQYLQSDFRYDERAHLALNSVNLNWAKTFAQNTTVSLGANEAVTKTLNRGTPNIGGEADQRRFGLNATVTQMINTPKIGVMTLGFTGSRNWFRDRVNQNANSIVSSLGVTSGWNPRPFFQMQTNFSVNWVAGERFSAGGSRITTAYIQPVFTWARAGWSVMPLVSINHMKSRLGGGVTTGDLLMAQTGGRVSWRAPGKWRFNTLSFEGMRSRASDGVSKSVLNTPRFLFLWTMVQPSKPPAEVPQQTAQSARQPSQAGGAAAAPASPGASDER